MRKAILPKKHTQYLLENLEANVTIKTENNSQIAEMYLYIKGGNPIDFIFDINGNKGF